MLTLLLVRAADALTLSNLQPDRDPLKESATLVDRQIVELGLVLAWFGIGMAYALVLAVAVWIGGASNARAETHVAALPAEFAIVGITLHGLRFVTLSLVIGWTRLRENRSQSRHFLTGPGYRPYEPRNRVLRFLLTSSDRDLVLQAVVACLILYVQVSS